MLNFAPISLKLFFAIGFLYAFIINMGPNSIVEYINKYDRTKITRPDTIIPLFTQDNASAALNSIDIIEISSFWKSFLKVGLRISIIFTRFIVLYNPMNYFPQVLSKICLYMNYIRLDSTMKKSIDSTTINRILKEIELLNPSKSNSSDTLKIQGGSFAIEKLKLFCFTSEPNEVFDKARSLKNISALYVIWAEIRFWLLPAVLIVLTGLYTYRHLQPKLRN